MLLIKNASSSHFITQLTRKRVIYMTKQEVIDEFNDMSLEEVEYTIAIYKIYNNKEYDLDTKIRKLKAVKMHKEEV